MMSTASRCWVWGVLFVFLATFSHRTTDSFKILVKYSQMAPQNTNTASISHRDAESKWAPLYAKKKSMFSEDLLRSIAESDAPEVEPVKSKKPDKKLSKLGLSGDFFSGLDKEEEGGSADEEESESSRKRREKKEAKKIAKGGKVGDDVMASGDDRRAAKEAAEEAEAEAEREAEREAEEKEKAQRKKKPSSRVRFMESSQPGFVSVGLDKVSLMFGNEVILDDASFSVSTGERVGLVGPNGSGKSTQLRILAGEIVPTSGDIVKSSPNIREAFLRQEFAEGLDLGRPLKDELLSAFVEQQKTLKEIEECEKEVETSTDSPKKMEATLDKLQKLQDKALATGCYSLSSKVEKIMDSCGFAKEDGANIVSSFSGGWKMRIGLAKILLLDPNVLFLDEPTNHLDLDSVIWLEDFLVKQNIPMIIVSHDREFLDKVCNKIVDMEEGKTVSYNNVNYSKFIEMRKVRLLQWKEKYERQTRYVQEEDKWIKKAKNDEQLAPQVKARQTALDKLRVSEEWLERPPKDKRFRFRFPEPPRCGQSIVEAQGLMHGYGTGKYKTLFKNVDFNVEKGERVGFIGPNGSGKSTMLRLVMGLEDPLAGFSEFASGSVEPKYFAQNQADQLDLDLTVLETLQEVAPSAYTLTDIRNLLGQFMFKGDDAEKKISFLSGGEKARVTLCRMMLEPANLLVLDEPTNHLDINSKEVLEEALLAFAGSVLVVSHDRYFLSQVVNTIFAFGDQTMERHDCDYYTFMGKEELHEGLQETVESRYVAGAGGVITPAKEVNIEKADPKKKNFGGSGVTGGNLFKGIKNAKRFAQG